MPPARLIPTANPEFDRCRKTAVSSLPFSDASPCFDKSKSKTLGSIASYMAPVVVSFKSRKAAVFFHAAL